MSLVDTITICSLTYGKPAEFPSPTVQSDSYSNQTVKVKAMTLPLEIGWFPVRLYTVFVSPIPEHTVGDRCFTRPNGASHCGGILSLCVVKAIVRGYAKHPPQLLLPLRGSVSFTKWS